MSELEQAGEEASRVSSDPLHGVTLKAIVEALVARHGWDGLHARVPLRCFEVEPSVPSSLKLLRKTPWARTKVEALYVELARKQKRNARRAAMRAHRDEAAPEGAAPTAAALDGVGAGQYPAATECT